MGWGVSYEREMYLHKQDYNDNPLQVQDKIDELEIEINNTKTKINMFASASPKDLLPKDWIEEPIRWINNEVDELIDYLHECIVHKHQLGLYLEYLNDKKED